MISARTKAALAAAKRAGCEARRGPRVLGLLLRHERPGGRPYRRARAIGHLPFRNCRRLDVSPCGPLQRASEERGIPAARGGKWSAVDC
jgi:hypothetical protein